MLSSRILMESLKQEALVKIDPVQRSECIPRMTSIRYYHYHVPHSRKPVLISRT